MKVRLFFGLLLSLLLVATAPVQGAVVVTATTGSVAYDAVPDGMDNAGVNVLKVITTSDASGDFVASITGLKGYLTAIYFIAGTSVGASTPTDNYDFDLIADFSDVGSTAIADSPNLLGTIADDLDSPTADGSGTTVLRIPIFSTVRLVGDNMGNAKKSTVIIFFDGG